MRISLLFTWLLLTFITLKLDGQARFDCDGQILVAANDDSVTLLQNPVYIPFGIPFLGIKGGYIGSFDALGFNSKDNYIYAYEKRLKNIVRLGSDNTFLRLGEVLMGDSLQIEGGDCNVDGLYFCYDNFSKQVLVFQVLGEFKLLRKIRLFWDPASAIKDRFNSFLYDFAFHPVMLETAYSYISHQDPDPGINGLLIKINLNLNDPNLGMVTPLKKISPASVKHLTGMGFDPNSGFYGYGSSSNGINPLQRSFFNIDLISAQAFDAITNTYSYPLSDMCSCPFPLYVSNKVPQEGMLCNNDSKTFIIRIDNKSYNVYSGITLHDSFPPGTLIKSVTDPFLAKIPNSSGIGTNILVINNLTVQPKSVTEIKVELQTISANDGPTYNQVFLTNLPLHFPKTIGSDDPDSSPLGDKSNFFFTTRPIQKLTWNTISPKDCIKANDGQIILKSPDFSAGQKYEIGLLNKLNWEERTSVISVGDQNSITIDSLLPGEYQLFRLRTFNANCSQSLKDTIIIVAPPNHLIDFRIKNNGPVCEGDNLLFETKIIEGGVMSWTGPDIFGSGDINPVIEKVTKSKTGKYEAKLKYGYCELSRTSEAVVKEKLNTNITGESTLCTGDSLILGASASNKNDTISYQWRSPSGVIGKDSILRRIVSSVAQSGSYKVITTNEACFDTSEIWVEVRQAPEIIMDSILVTDFCDEVRLQPGIKNAMSASFRWTPDADLSCFDCLNPSLKAVSDSKLKLSVVNDNGCEDTAEVRVLLNLNNLIFTPNIINKNQGLNRSVFRVIPNCAVRKILHLSVFDRLGNVVHEYENTRHQEESIDWDLNAKPSTHHVGVYVWKVKLELHNGSITYVTGDITIL